MPGSASIACNGKCAVALRQRIDCRSSVMPGSASIACNGKCAVARGRQVHPVLLQQHIEEHQQTFRSGNIIEGVVKFTGKFQHRRASIRALMASLFLQH